MTPHIEAKPGDYGEIVLFPGDPKRAEFLAKELLHQPRRINSIRGCSGFSGLYKGQKISIQASGMGMASASIYAFELFKYFNVQKLVRIGTCGTYCKEVAVGQWTICQTAITESSIYQGIVEDESDKGVRVINAKKDLLNALNRDERFLGVTVHSTDEFYQFASPPTLAARAQTVDMETFALLLLAEKFDRQANSINLCSDSLTSKSTQLSPDQRVNQTLEMTEEVLNQLCTD